MSGQGSAKPPILEVLEHYGYQTPPNPKRGGWSKMRCILPGHDDRNPSASISLEDNRFSCHACAVTLDSWEIIMDQEGLSFGQAKQFAADKFGTENGGSGRKVRTVPRTRPRLFE